MSYCWWGNLVQCKKEKDIILNFLLLSEPAELWIQYVNIFVRGQILVGLDNIRRNDNFCENNLESEITQNQTTKKKT